MTPSRTPSRTPSGTLFHKPPAARGIFPKGWVTREEQATFLEYLGPYYTSANKAGSREQFMEMVFVLWFDRFPVSVESEDPDELEWAISAQKKVRPA